MGEGGQEEYEGEKGQERRSEKMGRNRKREEILGRGREDNWLETQNSRDCGLGKYKIMYLAL